MQDFGKRLAAKLGIPFVQALRKRANTHEQKEMQNSSMQLRNLLGAFQIMATPFQADSQASQPGGFKAALTKLAKRMEGDPGSGLRLPVSPVLLLDDVVDSGWTLTMAAVLLRQYGSGPVFPFALAKASLRGS
jgi:ATP-dependent DNA helicase RecQ